MPQLEAESNSAILMASTSNCRMQVEQAKLAWTQTLWAPSAFGDRTW